MVGFGLLILVILESDRCFHLFFGLLSLILGALLQEF